MKNKNFNPKVSIIIPVYNGSNYLEEAIDSALAQTYKNIEILVVNDGSNDRGKTEKICKSYGNKIRYFKKENGGVASALNLGIEKMKGEYFSWLSHDDVYYPEKVEIQVEKLLQIKDRDNAIIYSGFEFIDENRNIRPTVYREELVDLSNFNNPFYPILKGILHGCSLLIPKKCFEQVGFFNTELKTTQDYDLWFRMFPKYKIICTPEILVQSRRHSEQGSKKIAGVKKEASRLWMHMLKNIPNKEITNLFGTKENFYDNVLEVARSGKYKQVEKHVLELKKQLKDSERFNPKVSIIIPVYNGSNYLSEAIESALKQTYKNLEIIVVNDGSEDNTEEIAKSYGDKIRYFWKKNGGTSTALNLGIKKMEGEYFSWLSHDDLYYPQKIERQIQELSKLKDKNTIMMSELDGINEKYEKIYETNYYQHIKNHPSRVKSKIYPVVYNQTHGCTLLIPKACFQKVGLFDLKERVAHDFEFFYRAFLHFPYKLIPEVLVTARDSSNRAGRRKKTLANIEYSRLYISIIKNLSEDEIKLLARDKLTFYLDMEEFFSCAGYTKALKYLRGKMLKNLQISSYDLIGNKFNGFDLHFDLRKKTIDSKCLVLYKQSEDPNTYAYNFMAKDATKTLMRQRIFYDSDVVHLHLIHNILDLNYLPIMTRLKPTVLSLHDPFFLGGHCVHHFDCQKWKTHCKDCPYLTEVFPLSSDFSSLNFELKKQAIQNSQISGIVASKWMKKKVQVSPIWKGKKIYSLPLAVDQSVFYPRNSITVRKHLNLDPDSLILMFRSDPGSFKGLEVIKKALEKIKSKKKITIITVVEEGLLDEFQEKFEIVEYGWINDDNLLAQLYNACDIFLMPSKQETFGMMAIEAMSCGKMVLALDAEGSALSEVINPPECGLVVKEKDFTRELQRLINHMEEVRSRGEKSLAYAQKYYSKERYVKNMIKIYKDVIANHKLDTTAELILKQLKKYPGDNDYEYCVDSVEDVLVESASTVEQAPLSRKVFRLLIPLKVRSVMKNVWLFIKEIPKMQNPPFSRRFLRKIVPLPIRHCTIKLFVVLSPEISARLFDSLKT